MTNVDDGNFEEGEEGEGDWGGDTGKKLNRGGGESSEEEEEEEEDEEEEEEDVEEEEEEGLQKRRRSGGRMRKQSLGSASPTEPVAELVAGALSPPPMSLRAGYAFKG